MSICHKSGQHVQVDKNINNMNKYLTDVPILHKLLTKLKCQHYKEMVYISYTWGKG